ncbi:MAG TPA: hypothetical protein VF131_11235 [Blastocatellia bacterium]|nr:hypothetical protein [Blastocatellia bacterium]
MVEHLTEREFEDYSRQQLGVAELLSVSDHLGECEACRRRIEHAVNGDAALFDLRAELFGEAAELSSLHLTRAHLTAGQTALYVDRSLSGEELQTVTDHLTGCEQCALAVNDLDAFRDQIAPSLDHEYRPATVPAPAEGWLHGAVAALLAPFRQSPGLAFGAVATVLLLAVPGWLLLRTPQINEPEREIVLALESLPQPTLPPQPAPAPVIAELNDGEGQLMLDQEGELSGAGALPIAYRKMLREALTARRIERSSQLKGLSRPSSSLMSADKQGSEFSVIEPVGKVLMSHRPTFRWSPMEGATAYVVEVYDSKFNLVTASPQLTDNSWAAPALVRGQVYCWQVKAVKDGQEFKSPVPPAPQAKFRILDQAKAGELAKAKRAYASSHLALGLLYAEAGLLNEAEQEFRLLRKANPKSEIARTLLSQVQALRRRS